MIMLAFSVHDKAVGAFLPVFFARSKGEAIRSFAAASTQQDHQFAKNAGDYTLYHVGQFDDVSGALEPVDPQRILNALEAGDGGNV